jgi:hypothetical protein
MFVLAEEAGWGGVEWEGSEIKEAMNARGLCGRERGAIVEVGGGSRGGGRSPKNAARSARSEEVRRLGVEGL